MRWSSTSPVDTNDSHVDDDARYIDQQGLVLLSVETTDTRDLIDTSTLERAAEDLAAVLGSS